VSQKESEHNEVDGMKKGVDTRSQKLKQTKPVIGRRVFSVQETVMNLGHIFRASFWYQTIGTSFCRQIIISLYSLCVSSLA